ncbi:MAG: NADPH-dependent F420 reductase [Chroococcidiopsidaceae cyanobacterium CP_BM_ER_R8_30]|nr:NADPH-dependent F420 reductase [Chroococcidiopsidaceae cyanobacterium CP_BM_ER_R8_30]
MKIGILGAGNVGGALGQSWAKKGHQVFFGVRDPNAPELQARLSKAGENVRVGSLQEATDFGEVIVLTLPWEAVEETLGAIAPSGSSRVTANLEGKILLDCTNPNFSADAEQYHPVSGGERVAAWVPKTKVVKIFNTTGWENMANPQYGSESLTMLYAGDDAEAKAVAAQLATDIGFEPLDAGPLVNSGLLESLAQLWGKLAYGQKLGRNIAFKLLQH